MALTTRHALPYPLPTADARLGAGDIQALAEAVDSRLSGAKVEADVATELVATATDDALNLTVDAAETSAVFTNQGANLIEYTGTPKVIATVFAQVNWATSAAGSRTVRIMRNGVVKATSRLAPDAEPFVQTLSWPVTLSTGVTLGLEVRQTSGGGLNVTNAKYIVVIHGISPP